MNFSFLELQRRNVSDFNSEFDIRKGSILVLRCRTLDHFRTLGKPQRVGKCSKLMTYNFRFLFYRSTQIELLQISPYLFYKHRESAANF